MDAAFGSVAFELSNRNGETIAQCMRSIAQSNTNGNGGIAGIAPNRDFSG